MPFDQAQPPADVFRTNGGDPLPTLIRESSNGDPAVLPTVPTIKKTGFPIIISTGTGQSEVRLQTSSVSISKLPPAPTGQDVGSAGSGAPPLDDSQGAKVIQGGALFAAVFFPIILLAGLIATAVICMRRRKRKMEEIREMKSLSQGPVERIPGARPSSLRPETTVQPRGAPSGAAAATTLPRIEEPPPAYQKTTVLAPIPQSPSPPYPQPKPLSEANLAMHGTASPRSPFIDPDDDQVSEVSDQGQRLGHPRHSVAVSVVSGISDMDGRTETDAHQVV
ncbi:MAG: hypothetical protein M1832_003728 [Thelocarpon impressellum]|nr:MAG: hypothetical protein M1832_003728 [Thelocarpon impressellum]